MSEMKNDCGLAGDEVRFIRAAAAGGLSEAENKLAEDPEWQTPEAKAILAQMRRNANALEDYNPFTEGPPPPLGFDPDKVEF